MTKIFIEVVNNSAFSKEKNKFVIRKSDENIEDWCNTIIQTFVSKNIDTLTIDAFYPINPFVKCYYLTKYSCSCNETCDLKLIRKNGNITSKGYCLFIVQNTSLNTIK